MNRTHQPRHDAVLGLHPRPVGVGQPQARAAQAVDLGVGGHQHLGRRLGRSVWGQRSQPRGLRDRAVLHRPDHRVGGGEHQCPHTGEPGRLEQRGRRRDVGAVGQLGMLHRAKHRGDGGEMHDRVDPTLQRCRDHFGLDEVTDDDVDRGIGMRLEVDHPHLGTGRHELGDDVPADESRASCDEDPAPAQVIRGGRAHSLSARAAAGQPRHPSPPRTKVRIQSLQVGVESFGPLPASGSWRSAVANRTRVGDGPIGWSADPQFTYRSFILRSARV